MSDLPFISAIGAGFSHAYSTTLWKRPKYFKWVYNQVLPTTFWFDNSIEQGIYAETQNKFCWLLESNSIIPNAIDFVYNNVELVSKSYKYLLTHNKDIADLAPNFHHIFPHGPWIEVPQVYPKTKLVSLISSAKNWTDGHRERLQFVEKFKDKVDLYGRGFNEFEKHEDALCDYCYSIVIENERRAGYASEKLFSCFAASVLPVYFGDPNIGEHFNMDGIILLDENFSLDKLSFRAYNERMPAIFDNLERVREYDVIENIIWNKYLKDL